MIVLILVGIVFGFALCMAWGTDKGKDGHVKVGNEWMTIEEYLRRYGGEKND